MFFLLTITVVQAQSKSKDITLDMFAGYAVPVNESYVDTYQNNDIYWNPNSGLNLDFRFKMDLSDSLTLALPINLNVGFFQYTTTDGRKVNTEADAGNTPVTTNTEWSIAPDIGLMLFADMGGNKKFIPYFGIGAAVGFLHSWETWDFTNNDGDDALLIISKFYDLTPVFKGEIGCIIPSKKKFDIKIAATFNMANYIMRKVILTNYLIAGNDTIDNFDEKSTVYNYAVDVPDENKGGDCLLAGFNYNNYPQQKISSNLTIKIGISY